MESPTAKCYYKKRSGCATIRGSLYEIKMASLLYFRGLNSGLDFQLAVNVDAADALDDVVFRYKPPGGTGGWCTCFIQVKHTNKPRLSIAKLTSESGQFSLPTYFKAHEVIKNTMSDPKCSELFSGDFENCFYVLFTNSKSNADLEDVCSVDVPKELKDFLSFDSGGVLRFNAEGKSQAEKEVTACLRDCDDASAFLNRLLVFCGQPSEGEFKGLIKTELTNFVKKTNRVDVNLDKLCEYFEEYMRNWCENGHYLLDKNSDIFDMALADACFYEERKIFALNVAFTGDALVTMRNVLHEKFSLLLVDCCEFTCRFSAIKLLGAISDSNPLISSVDTFLKNQAELTRRWMKRDSVFLVLFVQQLPADLQTLIETVKRLREIAGHQTNKRLVILSGLSNDASLADALTTEFGEGFARLNDEFAFSQFDENSRTTILEKTVRHQGFDTTLINIVTGGQSSDVDLDAISVIQILDSGGQSISTGTDLPKEIAYYVPRFVQRSTTVNNNILRADLSETIAIVVSSIVDIKTLLMNADETISGKQFEDSLLKIAQYDFVADNANSEVLASELFLLGTRKCNFVRLRHWEGELLFGLRVYPQNKPDTIASFIFLLKETCQADVKVLSEFLQAKHVLHYEGQKLEWTSSGGGDINLVRAHIEDAELTVLDENRLGSLEDRLVLVAAEPGMGKSTLIARIAKQAKETCPYIWTIAISLNDQTNLFAEKVHEDVVDFLTRASGMDTHLCKTLLSRALEVTGNVVVLLDGYDEVMPDYGEACRLLLANLLKTKTKKVWLTSRSTFQSHLEDQLSTLAFKLRKFDGEDQRFFFKAFWKEARAKNSTKAIDEERLDDFITDLIAMMARDIKDNEKELLGVPLQTRMMAEIYQDHAVGDVEMSTSTKMDLLQLLEAFVDKKICLQLARRGLNTAVVNYEHRRKKKKKQSIKKHMLAALVSFFNEEDVARFIPNKSFKKSFKKLNAFFQEISLGYDRTDIIENIRENKPCFMHRVFVEFFVAKWFAKNFEYHTPFLEKTLYTKDFEVVRKIFDRILAQDCPLHMAVLNQDFTTVLDLTSSVDRVDVQATDLGGRTALHLAAAYGTTNNQKENDLIQHILNIVCVSSYSEANLKDRVLESSPYRYAHITQSWATVEYLLHYTLDADTTLLANPEDQARLECIFTHDLDMLMRLLLKIGLPVDHVLPDTGQRLLHRACYRGSERVAQVLIQGNANRFQTDSEDESPLHIACRRGDVFMTKLLIEEELYCSKPIEDLRSSVRSAQINARDKFGRTALHQAAIGGRCQLVAYLIDLGAAIDVRDYAYGSTVLHHAAVSPKGKEIAAIVHVLISKLDKAAIYPFLTARTLYGDTAIHWAAYGGFLNAVKILASTGIPTDMINVQGETPLMQAAANGHAYVVMVLINCYRGDAKRYVNMEDRTGMTALDHSAMFDHSDVADILIERGADVKHRDCFGETCLHIAAGNGHQNVVKSILEAVDPTERAAVANITDNFGETALDVASKCNNEEVEQLLVTYGRNSSNALGDWSKDLTLHPVAASQQHLDNYEGGRDIETEELDGMTLQLAADRGLKDLVIKMIEAQGEEEKVRYVNNRDENGNTALHWAARKQCPEIIKTLINAGARVDSLNHCHESPLVLACTEGNLDVVKSIVEGFEKVDSVMVGAKRSFINSPDLDGWTALHHLSDGGHTEALSYLIEQGADIRARDREAGGTPLHFAVEESHSDVVNILINACPITERENYVNLRNKYGNTALLLAATDECVDCVDLLVRAGGDKSHSNAGGYSPLMIAAVCGHEENVKYLLEIFEDPNAKSAYIQMKNKDGFTALHLAASAGYKDCVVTLLDHGASLQNRGGIADSTLLHLASETGNFDLVKTILETIPQEEKNSYITTVDSEGNTALHLAACEDSVEVVSLLIKSGISMFVENEAKETPFSLAAKHGQLDVVKYILDLCKGIQPKAGDSNERRGLTKDTSIHEYINGNAYSTTPLQKAVSNCQTDVVEFLIKQGVEINTSSIRYIRLLQKAAKNGDADTIKVLIDAVEDTDFNGTIFDQNDYEIDSFGYYRQTALYLAAEAGSLEVVEYLVKAGANVTIIGDSLYNQTPLMVAAANGHLEVVKYLLDNCELGKTGIGCKRDYILLQDKFGKTAISLGEDELQIKVVELLRGML